MDTKYHLFYPSIKPLITILIIIYFMKEKMLEDL